jgi:hypothetical protein
VGITYTLSLRFISPLVSPPLHFFLSPSPKYIPVYVLLDIFVNFANFVFSKTHFFCNFDSFKKLAKIALIFAKHTNHFPTSSMKFLLNKIFLGFGETLFFRISSVSRNS